MYLLNDLRAASIRLLVPWTGVWIADVDVVLDPVTKAMPKGPATLTIGTTVLVGTIDDRSSGVFAELAKVRLVGGGGGWDKPLDPASWHNDAGVTSTAVYMATAAAAGEKLVELGVPSRFGNDYVRMAGAASSVFAGVDWYVTFQGITTVGARIPLPLSPLATILSWEANDHRAELASEELVLPGTILVDDRFGTKTVRDVEQTFDEGGARVIAWCDKPSSATPGSKLLSALASIARASTDVPNLRLYLYRVVAQGADGRLTLQAVKKASPDLRAIPIRPGMSGLSAKIAPGSEVVVAMLDGKPPQPFVFAFDGSTPLELDLAASVAIKLTAPLVSVGAGTHPVACADALLAWATAVVAACAAHVPPITIAPLAPAVASTKLFTE